jgi:hypothetical protein
MGVLGIRPEIASFGERVAAGTSHGERWQLLGALRADTGHRAALRLPGSSRRRESRLSTSASFSVFSVLARVLMKQASQVLVREKSPCIVR